MSSITGLENIDRQKYAILFLLDNIGIDISPIDGHLFYEIIDTMPIYANNKVLRVDGIGKVQKDIQYSSFNPITRVDHAQLLFRFVLEKMMFEGELTEDSVENYECNVDINLGEKLTDTQQQYEITLKHNDLKAEGVGVHDDEAIATCLAVIDFMKNSKYIDNNIAMKCHDNILAAYGEYLRLQSMSSKERRAELREKKKLLYEGNTIEETEEIMDSDISGIIEANKAAIEKENIVYEDYPETEEAEFSDKDFENESDDFDDDDSSFESEICEETVVDEEDNTNIPAYVTGESTPIEADIINEPEETSNEIPTEVLLESGKSAVDIANEVINNIESEESVSDLIEENGISEDSEVVEPEVQNNDDRLNDDEIEFLKSIGIEVGKSSPSPQPSLQQPQQQFMLNQGLYYQPPMNQQSMIPPQNPYDPYSNYHVGM